MTASAPPPDGPAHPPPRGGWVSGIRDITLPLTVLAIAVVLAVALDGLYRGRLRGDQRAEIQATASGLGNALASALNHRMALLNGLRAFVEIHADRPGFRDDFTAYATRLHGGVSGIRAVQWVQRGVIQQSFPLAGNEATIGYNLLADPRAFIREEYRRAEQGTGIVISGPAELVQGGLGLIARMPARDPAGRLLAVVAVVIDLPPLFAEAGLEDNATVQVGLRAQEVGVFAGTDAVFGADPILVSVPVADGRWDLAVAPAPGWAGAIQSQVTLAQLVLALVVLLATLSAWLSDSRGKARAREVAERERRLGEEKFARLFALSPDAAFLTRLRDEVVLEANDGVAGMLGTSREAVVGQTLGDLMQQVASNDWLTAIRAVRDQGTVRSTPIQFRSGTGQVRHGLYAGRTITLDGEPCVLSLIQDVTDQRRLEEQLAHAQKLEAVGRLAGGVAHDFNNVITAISGYAQLLSTSLGHDDPRRADADEIQKAALRAARMTQQLLAFARRQIVQPRVIDLNALIREVTRLLRRLIGEQVALDLVLADTALPVRVDPGQIEQVLANLAINARDAMPEGGTVTIATRLDGQSVVLEVRDTGMGMSEAVRTMAFEPFFTTKAQGKGTGLGLATVYGIVEQSGGEITLESEEGCGTRFTIRLPRSEEPIGDEAAPVAVRWVPRGSERILLAEDEPQVRRLAERTLTSVGYEVRAAENGEQALQHLESAPFEFDLLVTDLVMPGIGGHELARRFREAAPSASVLFISGYTDDDATRKGLLAAGQSFLPKPFTPSELVGRVREVLESGQTPATRLPPGQPVG